MIIIRLLIMRVVCFCRENDKIRTNCVKYIFYITGILLRYFLKLRATIFEIAVISRPFSIIEQSRSFEVTATDRRKINWQQIVKRIVKAILCVL